MPRKPGRAALTSTDLKAILVTVAGADSLLPGAVAELGRRLFSCECGHPRERLGDGKGHRDGSGRCFDCEALDTYEAPLEKRCRRFRGSANATEAAGIVKTLSMLARHEGRADREMGLDKREPQEMIPWLVAVDVGRFKRATAAEQDRMLLEAMGVSEGEVRDAEIVDAGDADRRRLGVGADAGGGPGEGGSEGSHGYEGTAGGDGGL